MKINFLGKAKWYIIGFILVAIMLSVSLSFSAWDTLSVKASLSIGNSGKFCDDPPYKLAQDFGKIGIIEVGDTVHYGNYYQTVNGDTLSALEWRVVDINSDGNYVLMTENVIANGCFYGDQYYLTDYTDKFGLPGAQKYNTSTTRAWLNSSTRFDGGTNFDDSAQIGRKVFNGFYSTAFNINDKSVIVPRKISGMRGSGIIYSTVDAGGEHAYEPLDAENIWLASAWELGFTNYNNNPIWDNQADTQFSYFRNDKSRISSSTPFTTSTLSNFTHIDATFLSNNTISDINIAEGAITPLPYVLRSPSPTVAWEVIVIETNGRVDDRITCRSTLGVRPCVVVSAIQSN